MTKRFLLIGSLALCGCNPSPATTDIHNRLRSPDGKIEALYAEDLSGGPATGVSEDIYVVHAGQFPRLADRVFSNECVHNLNMHWTGNRRLAISYSVGSEIHEHQGRDDPQTWQYPWLWGESPSSTVLLSFSRIVLKGGNDC